MPVDQLATAIRGAPLRTLDDLSRDVWRALDAGMLSDDDAQRLAEAIHARRNAHRNTPGTALGTPRTASKLDRTWSYFPPKKRPQRAPDRQRSLERRRTLAASGPLPPALAAKFTTGEQAVLRIVADEVRDCDGACRLTVPELAARSGTSESTVRRAFKEASRLGLVTIEERRVPYRPNLSNVVRVISREWSAWIAKARRRVRTVNPLASASVPQGEGAKGGRPRKERVFRKGFDRPRRL